jgi:hypothetical protein
MQNIHIATIIIIAANVIISMKGFKDFSFFEKYKFNIAGIRRGEQIRMLSSGFLHADYNHLCWSDAVCLNLSSQFASWKPLILLFS